jgi:hypothetical protein
MRRPHGPGAGRLAEQHLYHGASHITALGGGGGGGGDIHEGAHFLLARPQIGLHVLLRQTPAGCLLHVGA